ncbi:P-loop containing nucleoside triphosphate hydrolase protein [Syncephalis pseudoplumigaleata]|uniref:RNA helicase n=1 Tax=Syncephalis pseudoplumigaleata TaxID=1712513 RepID=A0A4P9Z616_9FUNG|nr:P-loop containing nucleoside triphosphate hydrolase protein [Syncephalis pseudoplumigaleata]|eukprot:RKP28087.1 P-loop containing nucleoside triphosphate hydrolase protein [Syncephalis pseudoplumigaleata]
MTPTLLVPRAVLLGKRGGGRGGASDRGDREKRARSPVPALLPVSKRARTASRALSSNDTAAAATATESLDSTTDTEREAINDAAPPSSRHSEDDDDAAFDEPVKEFAYYQRPALPDEPVCVVCGRYGEYISDTTEHDVCSRSAAAAPSIMPIYRPVERFHAHLVAYQPHPSMAKYAADELEAFRLAKHIKARGRHIPPLLADFDHLTLPDQLRSNLRDAGYHAPTPVQMQVIPAALAARDVVAAAPTGSGKTLAFLLPCIVHAYALSGAFHGEGRPYVFVVAPTHDLCAQFEWAAQKLCRGLPDMRTALITGERPIPPQWHRLHRGVSLVFGTPGRLDRILETWPSTMARPRADIIVLDEVDRLVDSEVKESLMRQLLGKLTGPEMPMRGEMGHPHQLMLFSATRAWRTRRIFKPWLHDPVRVAIGDLDMVTPDVRQTFFWVESNAKKRRLFLLLNDPIRYPLPAIVFVESRVGAELLAKAIAKRCPGVRARHVHGETPGAEREAILHAGLTSSTEVIVATSGLWARGIDMPRVRLVINFDMPRHLDEYIHQVGRAGRAGEAGRAVTFINDESKSLFRDLLEMLRSLPSSKVDSLPVELRRYAAQRHPIESVLANPHARQIGIQVYTAIDRATDEEGAQIHRQSIIHT